MKILDEDLKKNIIKNIYVLYGSQAYLRNQYRDRIIKMILPEGDTLNINYYNSDNFSANEIIDLAETMPFLAERRIIVMENTGIFKDGCEEMEAYLDSVCETTVLIFSEEAIDGKRKITKTAKANGSVAEFKDPSENDISMWVRGKINKENKQITRDALDYLLKNSGSDMFSIVSELEKVFSYTYGRDSINLKDVEAVCTKQIDDTVFSMMDAMFTGNVDLAMKYYADIVALQVDPIKTLALISGQLRLLIKIKTMYENGLSVKEISKKLSANEYRVQKALPHAKKSSKIWLMKGLEMCADSDYKLKNSGNKKVSQMILENIILTLAGMDETDK